MHARSSWLACHSSTKGIPWLRVQVREETKMIRYKKLGYVELNVSDLMKSRRFYEDIVGLEFVGERSDGAVMFRCDDEDPRSVVLHQKQPAGFKSVGWMLEDESQFELLHRRLRDAIVPYEELGPSQCDLREATRVTRTMEPHSRAAWKFFPADVPRPAKPFATTHTKIQRLGHVVWSVPQEAESIAFFRHVLNFRESDSIGEIMTFMRPFPSPFHHGIGIGKGPKGVI